jgi:hypothetical protein
MFKKNKIVEFYKDKSWLIGLTLAKTKIPQWYKDQKMFKYENELKSETVTPKSFKACIPFLDAMTSGYVIELWTDIHVKKNGKDIIVTWENDLNPVGFRGNDVNDKLPTPIGCNPNQFVWLFPYTIKVPKGYSCLVTHPLNRMDLPFLGLTAIVDNEVAILGPGNYPFFFKDEFEGIIKAGTPIMQIIPFKRENWKLKENLKLKEEVLLLQEKTHSVSSGYYKKNIWKKKDYL